MNIKSKGAKYPLKLTPPPPEPKRQIVVCPNCGSDNVYTHILVSGFAMVNINNLEHEPPEESDCCWSDVEHAEELSCSECDEEWVK